MCFPWCWQPIANPPPHIAAFFSPQALRVSDLMKACCKTGQPRPVNTSMNKTNKRTGAVSRKGAINRPNLKAVCGERFVAVVFFWNVAVFFFLKPDLWSFFPKLYCILLKFLLHFWSRFVSSILFFAHQLFALDLCDHNFKVLKVFKKSFFFCVCCT